MFIKKDLRKIPQILSDAASRAASSPPSPDDPAADDATNANDGKDGVVEEMRFARRAPEFLPSRGVSMLLEPKYCPALDNLVQLSLYDCGLKSLAGIELSGDGAAPLFPKLTSLDIGRNPDLTNDSLPGTFHTQFPKLLQLWSDDCGFGPNIPATLLEMDKLRVVRMTGNKLEGELEDGIGIRYWKSARVLALDGNKLTSVGRGLGRMECLEKLHLRGNELTALPEGVPGRDNHSLTTLGLSSNRLTSLPASLADAGAILKELYLNGNRIEEMLEGLAEKLVGLERLNLAHNSIGKGTNATAGSQRSNDDGDVAMEDSEEDDVIRHLPRDFVDRFGAPEPLTGLCAKDDKCVVRMEGNPMAESLRKRHLEEEKRRAKQIAMDAKANQTAMETELVQ
mmetsp:Transcript_26522/g.56425  ORF Transcript_26522/g.56425 Transcript_26522/m.56425 type:complete len:396 (+) Transcript_26522:107-1294(+)